MPLTQKEERLLRQFGYRLRDLRDRLGLSQGDLAELSGLHVTYVSSVERGHRNVSLTTVYRLARALGEPPGRLLPVDSQSVAG